MRPAVSALLLLLSAAAHADPATTATVAVTPPRERGLAARESDRLEQLLVEAFRGTDLRIANLSGAHFAAGQSAAEGMSDDLTARAAALGREFGAPLALAVDAAPLGDGVVVSLQGVDVARDRQIATAVFTLGGSPDVGALSGELVRVLSPERWRGRLAFHFDVAGAQLLVDGAPVALAPGAPLSLPCGTHSLRVTHPAYRDFLRFVTVEYGQTTPIDVELSRYPVDEGELRAREAARKPSPPALAAPPWYRGWWVVGLASAVLLSVGAAVAAVTARSALHAP